MDSMFFFFYFLFFELAIGINVLFFCFLNWLINLGRPRIVFSEWKNFASCHLFYHIVSWSIRGGILVDLSIEKLSDLGYTDIFRSLARIAGRGVRSRTGARWQDQHTKENRANGIKELSHWLRQQQRQCPKVWSWLVDWRKNIRLQSPNNIFFQWVLGLS